MADRPLPDQLPADLPEDWTSGQIVAPEGADAGLSEQHGYNYLMAQVNAAQRAVNAINEGFDTISGKRTCRFVVGTSTAGWTQADCDYLCDGTDDQVEIGNAITSLKEYGGGEIVILSGEYNLTSDLYIEPEQGKVNVTISGTRGATVLNISNIVIMALEGLCDFLFRDLTLQAADSGSINAQSGASLSLQSCELINVRLMASRTPSEAAKKFAIASSRFVLTTDFTGGSLFGLTLEADDEVNISGNFIAINAPAASSSRLLSVQRARSCIFSNNEVFCSNPGWGVLVDRGKLIAAGNILDGVFIDVEYGGLILGNRVRNGYITAYNMPLSGDTQEKLNGRGCTVTGNFVDGGRIYVYGSVSVSGNVVVNAPTDEAAIVVRKSFSGNAANGGPVIASNLIAGCGIAIQLTVNDQLSAPNQLASGALISGNRIRDCETPIQIEANWSGCLVSNNLFNGSVVDYGTDNVIHLNNDDTGGGSGGTAGVASFKGRTGAVVPQAGDYTAAMVGAMASGAVQAVQAVTQAEYDALADKNASTLYLIKE